MKKVSGFTIVELVVVIIILGILAATALPRFIDVSDEAHSATVDAVMGGLKSAQGMAHAKWMASGKPTSIQINGNAHNTTTAGYVVSGATATTCYNLFVDMIQDSTSAVSSAAQSYNDTVDWHATGASNTCTFTYDARGSTGTNSVLQMSGDNGTVTRTN
jgi:prepilin-type N-terminal cleavage/methylation domain-containing protein